MGKPELQGVAPSRRASIRRKCSDAVADLIRSRIFQAGQPPIDRLPQKSALIEILGSSRATIRTILTATSKLAKQSFS